ncbi:MAG: hypothetical protein GY862_22120 [Gammaproteobacteria bacterium]|nr:hypothetical protein [Gammaproteobacteria bacterium]
MLVIRKGNQEYLRIENSGKPVFTPFHQEYAATGGTSGELAITRNSEVCMDSAQQGGTRALRLAGRLHQTAILPENGLMFKHGSDTLAELDSSGDLYTKGSLAGTLPAPGQNGSIGWSSAVYAAPGLDYTDMVAASEYAIFESPTANFDTRTIDISDFKDVLPTSDNWPFEATTVPINGILRIPTGAGPFPVALFVHGNHTVFDNSTNGYVYLLELMASQGIIAASIDCNFLNGFVYGENDARAIIHLEHMRQMQLWNAQAGHPLQNKVDLSRVMMVGHSRGGEGVGHASLFNGLSSVVPVPGEPAVPLDGSAGLGPYGFNLRAVVAIAPTDSQYTPVTGSTTVHDNYFIIHGSKDEDVWPFIGYQTYDRAHPVDLADPTQDADGLKSLLWLIGGNHNYFNSAWSNEGSPTISRAEQEGVAKAYVGAIAQAMLLNRPAYLDMLRDHTEAWDNGWIPSSIELISQYQDPCRLFIDHYEHGTAGQPSPPVTGTMTATGMTATEMSLNGSLDGNTFQETNAVKLDWSAAGGRYTAQVTGGLAIGRHQYLVVRTGQSNARENTAGVDQDFTITLTDGVNSHTVKASGYARLPYPDALFNDTLRSVMQTLRVPLRHFADNNVDLASIQEIVLGFDEPKIGTSTVAGSLYLDDIQISG